MLEQRLIQILGRGDFSLNLGKKKYCWIMIQNRRNKFRVKKISKLFLKKIANFFFKIVPSACLRRENRASSSVLKTSLIGFLPCPSLEATNQGRGAVLCFPDWKSLCEFFAFRDNWLWWDLLINNKSWKLAFLFSSLLLTGFSFCAL